MISEEKLETKSPNVVTPDLGVVFDVQIYGRAQDGERELFKQKNIASTRMKASGCTVRGILK